MDTVFWIIFFMLLAIGVLGTLAVIPYSLALNPAGLEALKAKQVEGKKSLPPRVVILLASYHAGTGVERGSGLPGAARRQPDGSATAHLHRHCRRPTGGCVAHRVRAVGRIRGSGFWRGPDGARALCILPAPARGAEGFGQTIRILEAGTGLLLWRHSWKRSCCACS